MPKPNAEEYAKQVLWMLSGMQAQIDLIQGHLILEASGGDQTKANELFETLSARRKEIQKTLYDEMVKNSGLM